MERLIHVGIDTGGTFTDGFLSDGERWEKVKVDTTPHDLTVCFLEALRAGAQRFGYDDLPPFLQRVGSLRYSTTVGVNACLQRLGARIGLLVTRGHEDDLYGNVPGHFLPFVGVDMICGLDEAVDAAGAVVRPLAEEAVLTAVRSLLERGAEIIAVSFRNSHLNPVHERLVKALVDRQYPKHYVGSVPVMLGAELSGRPDEQTRTNLLLLNSYIHKDMVRYLYKAEDEIRDRGYRHPLLVVHASGGVARVAKTRAVDTLGSGPVAGVTGAHAWAQRYGLKDVVLIDIGGTSTDIGLMLDGRIPFGVGRTIFDLPVSVPLVEVFSVGSGGGSIAQVRDGRLTVGPESAGARPGPVCYNLGGNKATVTDANLVQGLINPAYFLGGKRQLQKARAEATIKRQVADPLGTSTEAGALAITEQLANDVARAVQRLVERVGRRPSEFVLFSSGGGAGLHCCRIAERLGMETVYTFPFSSVFGAFGCASMDVVHLYEARGSTGDPAALERALDKMLTQALRDMRGEGLPLEHLRLTVEGEAAGDRPLGGSAAEMGRSAVAVAWAWPDEDTRAAAGRLVAAAAAADLPLNLLRLTASLPLAGYDPGCRGPMTAGGEALKEKRAIHWPGGSLNTPVYTLERLSAGQAVTGPAVLEGEDTTYAVPAGWRFTIDSYGNGLLARTEGRGS